MDSTDEPILPEKERQDPIIQQAGKHNKFLMAGIVVVLIAAAATASYIFLYRQKALAIPTSDEGKTSTSQYSDEEIEATINQAYKQYLNGDSVGARILLDEISITEHLKNGAKYRFYNLMSKLYADTNTLHSNQYDLLAKDYLERYTEEGE